MRKNKNTRSAAVRTASRLAMRVIQPDNSPKMANLKALLASGQAEAEGPVFHPDELEHHGNVIEKGNHAVGAPLSRWRLIKGSVEITGTVHREENGAAAGDGDTNFELFIPELDPATGQLSEEAKAINAKIDAFNDGLDPQGNPAPHIEDAEPNRIPGGSIAIHCEVDDSDLDALKDDLSPMMIGDCYVVSGQLVLDTWHGGLYELHPVQTIDRC
jgi:hypothetical protein